MTVINGPPERSRTRSPLRNGGSAAFCIAIFDGAGAGKAGGNGTLSASPNITAIGTRLICLVEGNILKLHFKRERPAGTHMEQHVEATAKAKVAISHL